MKKTWPLFVIPLLALVGYIVGQTINFNAPVAVDSLKAVNGITTGTAGTSSGALIQKGLTSGQAGLGVNDVAGNMHIGLFPIVAPTLNQLLSVSALNVTCPTNLAYSGLQCDQLAWATGGGVTVSGYYTTIGASKYCSTPLQICTPASGLTILNTAGSSVINSTGGTQVLQSAPVASDNLVMAGGSIAGGNTTGIISVNCFMAPSTGQTGWPRCGVTLRESSTSKMVTVDIVLIGNTAASAKIRLESWSTQTTFGTSIATTEIATASSQIWVKFTCSVAGCQSGNVTVQVSADGINYAAGLTEVVTAHFTTGPNQWGIFGSPGSSTDAMYVPIQSYVIQ